MLPLKEKIMSHVLPLRSSSPSYAWHEDFSDVSPGRRTSTSYRGSDVSDIMEPIPRLWSVLYPTLGSPTDDAVIEMGQTLPRDASFKITILRLASSQEEIPLHFEDVIDHEHHGRSVSSKIWKNPEGEDLLVFPFPFLDAQEELAPFMVSLTLKMVTKITPDILCVENPAIAGPLFDKIRKIALSKLPYLVFDISSFEPSLEGFNQALASSHRNWFRPNVDSTCASFPDPFMSGAAFYFMRQNGGVEKNEQLMKMDADNYLRLIENSNGQTSPQENSNRQGSPCMLWCAAIAMVGIRIPLYLTMWLLGPLLRFICKRTFYTD